MCNILSAVGAVLSDTSSDMSSLFDESALSILAGFGPSTLASATTFQQKKLSPKKPIRQLSSSHINAINQVSIKQHENLSNILKIGPSSRPQLTHCLIDGSLETFWESGDEDKNRARRLNISWDNEIYRLELLGIFIDNIRDTNFKVSQITIRNSKIIIYNASVDWTFVGWIKVLISSADNLQIHLKGSEAGCRLRQIAVFGQKVFVETFEDGINAKKERTPIKQSNSHQLLFSTAQMDAFILFQAIAAQVSFF
uniref:DOC domain-containing protein n=1 Tax=Panagrolaimus davidi TaxID=227884 RepID=A0A914P7K3_9BILA